PEPVYHFGRKAPGQEADLHLVEQVESRVAALDGAPAALLGALDPLQRHQRLDPTDRADRAGPGRRLGGLVLRQAERAGGRAAGASRGGGGGRSIGSRYAHGEDLSRQYRTLGPQWLRTGKDPAKSAARGQPMPRRGPCRGTTCEDFLLQDQSSSPISQTGTRFASQLASDWGELDDDDFHSRACRARGGVAPDEPSA